MDSEKRARLAALPKIDETVGRLDRLWDGRFPTWAMTEAVRSAVEALRRTILDDGPAPARPLEAVVEELAAELVRPSLRPLFNATGVVVHTNLGRAPLHRAVMDRVASVASGYSNLEYDLEAGHRGSRHGHVGDLVCRLTGAEDAVVVNNNAAAVLLCLTALAHGHEVVVSRGELVEIGGSFRIPDVMAASGAVLREVGTTNRTHPADYRRAITDDTALLFKAHRSNYAVVGFTREVEMAELSTIGREAGVPTMYDMGSGCLMDLRPLGIDGESAVQGALADGIDLVTFSGDKLLGGPQAGIIVGKAELVARVRSHPLMRPLRPDKMTLAALTATLEAYRDHTHHDLVPVVRMLSTPEAELKKRAQGLRRRLRRRLDREVALGLVAVASKVGGGSSPLAELPSWAVSLSHPEQSANALERRLRRHEPPIIGRIERDTLLLDLRTLDPAQLGPLADATAEALA